VDLSLRNRTLFTAFANKVFLIARINTNTLSPFNSQFKHTNPSYDWGWGVNVGYIFPQTANDINVDYWQLNSDHSDSVAGTNLTTTFVTFTDVTVNSNTVTNANAKGELDFNQVDLTFGQFINIGGNLQLHPKAGIEFAQVEGKLRLIP
jgi:hypothetical protein